MMGTVLIIITSLFFMGILLRTKSVFSGRKGPGIFQPLKDIRRLIKKNVIYSETTSTISRIAPSIYFSSMVIAILLIPFGRFSGVFSFPGDFIFFAYVLAVGKFFMVLSAMDTGSSFQGMGASREALYTMLVEPVFFLLMGAFALYTGHTSFSSIFQQLHFESWIAHTLAILATFLLVILAMVENSRMPVDDPTTHLELTMIHEVMILDHSGFDLGLIMHTMSLRFALYGALIANIFIPSDLPMLYAMPLFFVVQVFFAVTAGTIESFTARFRMYHNAQYIFALTSISILVFLGVLIMLGKID